MNLPVVCLCWRIYPSPYIVLAVTAGNTAETHQSLSGNIFLVNVSLALMELYGDYALEKEFLICLTVYKLLSVILSND